VDINQLIKELELLKKENNYLKQLLSNMMHEREKTVETVGKLVSGKSSTEEKIALFKTFFKGRTDVFAYRWESKDGKRGYTPACECRHRKLTPLTNQVLFKHLSGEKTVGLYPLLQDETCFS